MNAEQLQNKIVNTVEKQKFYKILAVATLLTAVIFPINLLFNPNVDPIMYDSPIMLLFGFLAFVCMISVYYVGGAVLLATVLDGGIRIHNSVGKFNANSILRDESLLSRMAKEFHEKLQKFRADDFVLQINEAKRGLQKQIDENKQEITQLKQENKESKKQEKRYNDIIAEQKQEIYNNHLEIKQDKELIKKLLSEKNDLLKENNQLKNGKKEKIQIIGDKAQSKNNSENTKFKKLKDIDE